MLSKEIALIDAVMHFADCIIFNQTFQIFDKFRVSTRINNLIKVGSRFEYVQNCHYLCRTRANDHYSIVEQILVTACKQIE